MSEYKPEVGDRVRVVYEGKVSSIDTLGFTIEDEVPVLDKDPGLVSIEKVEPPVTTFGPGDVVQRKGSILKRLITDDGWVAVGEGWSFPGTHMTERLAHTSEDYERVEL